MARGYPLGVMMTMETGNPDLSSGSNPRGHQPAGRDAAGTAPDGWAAAADVPVSGAGIGTCRGNDGAPGASDYSATTTSTSGPPPTTRSRWKNAILSVPGDKKLPRIDEHGKRTAVDLTTQDNEVAAGMFPLRLVYSTGENQWRRANDEIDPETWDLFERTVLSEIDGYKVPVIRLTRSATKEAICAVFEDVNTRGVSLNVFRTTATALRYAVSDFHLPTDWAAVRERLVKSDVLTDFNDTDFLRAISLVSTYFARRGRAGTDPYTAPAASCKRSDILGLKLSEYQKWSPRSSKPWSGARGSSHGRASTAGRSAVHQPAQLAGSHQDRPRRRGRRQGGGGQDRPLVLVRRARRAVQRPLDSRLPRDLEQVTPG